MKESFWRKKYQGQILIEVVIGILILGVIFGGSLALISTSLKSQKTSTKRDIANSLLQEAHEVLRVLALKNWFDLYDKKESGFYHLEKSGGQWEIEDEKGTIDIGGASFTRYFEVKDVTNPLKSPLKLRVKVYVKWGKTTITSEEVISRYQTETWAQDDWSGGSVGDQIISWTQTTSTFTTSSEIHFASSGLIMLSD